MRPSSKGSRTDAVRFAGRAGRGADGARGRVRVSVLSATAWQRAVQGRRRVCRQRWGWRRLTSERAWRGAAGASALETGDSQANPSLSTSGSPDSGFQARSCLLGGTRGPLGREWWGGHGWVGGIDALGAAAAWGGGR